jgi:hypothetical protein
MRAMILHFDGSRRAASQGSRARDRAVRETQRTNLLAANVATPHAYRFARESPLPGLSESETIVYRHLTNMVLDAPAGRRLSADLAEESPSYARAALAKLQWTEQHQHIEPYVLTCLMEAIDAVVEHIQKQGEIHPCG